MKNRAVNRILLILVLAVLFVPEAAMAQRKKRGTEAAAQGMRLREAEFFFTEGEKYFILEDYAKALDAYHRALEIHPESGTIHYKIAQVLSLSENQEDQVKAVGRIEEALRLDKDNKYFYLLAADIYNNLGQFNKAAETYESLLERIEGAERYLYDLAAVYQYADKPEEAIRTYNRAEKAFGVNETSSIQKLKLFLELGRKPEALAEGEKLISAFPEESRYVMALAEVISASGMRDQAISYLERFVSEHPNFPEVEMLLAGYYRDAGQEEKAQPLLLRLFDNPGIPLRSKVIILGAYNAELHERRDGHVF